MDPVTVKLSSPIMVNGEQRDTLTFREAEIGDALAADTFKGDSAKIAATLASMADVTLPDFKKVKVSDFNTILDKVQPLLGNASTATTGEPSQD